MVDPAGHVLHLLVQRAAQGHIQFLDAAADRQHRQAARHRRADQRQRGVVAPRVVPVGRQRLRHAIAVRLDIAAAARQQQPVQPVEHRHQPLALGRQQDRDGAGPADHRRAVAGRGRVLDQSVDVPVAGRDPDDKAHGNA